MKKDDDDMQYARKCHKLKVAFVNRILSSLELNIIYISYSCVYNVFQCIDSIVFVRVFVYMHIYLRAYWLFPFTWITHGVGKIRHNSVVKETVIHVGYTLLERLVVSLKIWCIVVVIPVKSFICYIQVITCCLFAFLHK